MVGLSWGCYLAPDDASTIESIVSAIVQRPRGAALPVADGFNAELADPEENRREEEIAAAMATAALKDTVVHFLPRRRARAQGGRT